MEQAELDQEAESLRLERIEAELEEALAATHAVSVPFAWENYTRSAFLIAMVAFLGFLAYQPTKVRLSMLLSLANPSHGDSLDWRPTARPQKPPAEPKRIVPPNEWRLGAGYTASWNSGRRESRIAPVSGSALARNNWPRFSSNPWSWQDDAQFRRHSLDADLALQPPQKSASQFRANPNEIWPDNPADITQTPVPSTTETDLPPLLPPLPGQAGLDTMTGLPASLPPLPGAPVPVTATPAITAPAIAPAANQRELPPLGALSPVQPTAPAVSTPPSSQQPPASAQPPAPAEEIDWLNTEITGPIPGAYLTIYPKLKFVGLCVPGQGYIRKYNQIGVPSDLVSPKMAARDGKTPYGKYYIADRHRDTDGPRLYLSWPSPEDAQRIGLDPARMSEVANAWRRQTLPPQDTPAGGGVGLNGLRNWVEVTEGGFALEEPHMEEIFTALPDKAWVFIQE